MFSPVFMMMMMMNWW